MMHFDKRVRIEVPKIWTNDDKGKFFEDLVANLLKRSRYKVTQRVDLTGMEIDVLAQHVDSGQKAYVECKFEKTPLHADVLTKALGNALTKRVPLVYVFSTSPPGKGAKGILEEERNREEGPKLSYHGPDSLFDWFQETNNLALPSLPSELSISAITLLITPSFWCWVAEESELGISRRAAVFQVEGRGEVDFEIVKDYWSGIELINTFESSNSRDESLVDIEEIITSISIADSFDDYRPCRPQDFVGRKSIQAKVFDFLERVRNQQNTTRIICFKGPSGHGKSSTLIKLAAESRKRKYKDKYFFYPIDVRSARSPLFVAKAVRAALQEAVDQSFVVSPGHRVGVGSTGFLLSSDSVQKILGDLDKNNRLIIIFFDQFEELFTKESLSSVFDAFNNLALEIDSLKANIVLGFSWRTGLNPPEDHKSFSFWHSLKDKRYEIPIEPFTREEAPELIKKLSKHLGEKLSERLRKRLLSDSQYLPWLLKKLSIHVYQQMQHGVTQLELLSKQLNAASLFDEDLAQLSKNEQLCLKYIAQHSPVERLNVMEKFETIPDKLVEKRLIVKVGQNYTLYWDIFREYFLNGTIPTVHWMYIPRTQLTAVIKAINLLQEKSMDVEELAEAIKYKPKSCLNLILDLQNFFLAKRDQQLVSIQSGLEKFELYEIADYLSRQLNEHIIAAKIRENFAVGKSISFVEFQQLFVKAYPENDFSCKRTLDTYSKRIIQWLIFAGILEKRSKILFIPLGEGAQKGIIPGDKEKENLQLSLLPNQG